MRTRPAFSTPVLIACLTLALLLVAGVARAQRGAPDAEDLSATQTGYIGAQLLAGDEQVTVAGIGQGRYPDDGEVRDRYLFWEGDSLFAGVIDEGSRNRVDMVAEFYWFESSIPRNSDFYVVVLKVTSTPEPSTDWKIANPGNLMDDMMFRNIGPAQDVIASVDRSGDNGAIRWDWSVPFQNYRWEPERVIQVSQDYTAGAHVEGGAMKSVTEGINIQAKGSADAKFRVSTRYTITLWRWEMRVSAGATDMEWQLTALDPEHSHDPGYHEYFLVLQSERGRPVHLDQLNIGSTLREHRFLLPDRFMDLSAALEGVTISAPELGADELGGCPEGSQEIDGECVGDCPVGFRVGDDGCVAICTDAQRWEGGACVPDCAVGERPWRDGCVADCDEGFVADGAKCVVDCDPGFVPDIGGRLCEPDCPSGTHAEGARCVDDADAANARCGRGTHEENGKCVADEIKPAADGPKPDDGPRVLPGGDGNGGFDPEGACESHDGCPFGSHCRAGICASECLTPDDCPQSQICNARAMCVEASFVGGGQSVAADEGDDASGGCATTATASASAATGPAALLRAFLGRR